MTVWKPTWTRAALLITAVLLLSNWQLLVGRVAPHWDAQALFGPQFSLVADHIKAGKLLLWDPWVAAGSPDLAEPEMGVTSPLMLLAGFVSPNPQAGFVAYWMFVWLFGAFGMLLLLRHLGAPVWGAVVVTLGYAACGFYTGHAEHTSSLYSFSFVPWIIWRLDASLHDRRLWPVVQAGVLYGLSALGGYPQLTILTGFLIALWVLGRVLFTEAVEPRANVRPRLRAAGYVVLIAVLGTAILAPIYVGFMTHTRGYSDRVGPRGREEALTSNPLPAPAFATLSSPYLAILNLAPKPIWPTTDVSMTSTYAGACVLLFAIWALRYRSRNRWRWYLAAVALLVCCCCVGNQLPIRGWLYDLVFPTRYFRNPALFRCYFIFLLSVLAGFGTRDLDQVYGRFRIRFFGLAGVVTAYTAVVVFAAVAHETDKRPSQYLIAVLHSILVWVGLAVLAIVVQRRVLTRDRMGRWFIAIAVVDAVLSIVISAPILYSSLDVPTWHAMNQLHRAELSLPDMNRVLRPPEIVGTIHNNDNIPLRVSTVQNYVTMTNRFDEYLASDPAVSSIAMGPHRIWFAPRAVPAAISDPAFALFVAQAHEHHAPVMFVHNANEMQYVTHATDPHRNAPAPSATDAAATLGTRASVSGLHYEPNSLEFSYQASQAGWLLVTDRWAPGWVVTVNGQSRPNTAADFIFRAVQVSPGLNVIKYAYKPTGFWPLVILSWGILALYAAIECFRLVRRPTVSRARLAPAEAVETAVS